MQQVRPRRQPASELLLVPGNSYHVAASDPDFCARQTLEFIRRRSGGPVAVDRS